MKAVFDAKKRRVEVGSSELHYTVDRELERRIERRRGSLLELKFRDFTVDQVVPATAAVTTCVSVIPQGDGPSDRDGRRCVAKSLYVRGTMQLGEGTTSTRTSQVCRFMVVRDKQVNGSTFSHLDLLVNADALSHIRLDNRDRFDILIDEMITLNATSGGNTTNYFPENTQYFEKYVECDVPIDYDGSATTGAVSTHRSSGLFVVLAQAFPDASQCSCKAYVRTRFIA